MQEVRMPEKVLFVDDEPNVLAAYERQLRKLFEVKTMEGGEAGLQAVMAGGPYAVVVSDFRMPNMDGVRFLSRVKEISPDTVRMILTGYADMQTAIEAVNEGNIFRFLTKPCPPESLTKAILAGIEQYRLVCAERELLEQTLKGTIQILTEILGLVNPEAFGRCSRIQKRARSIVLLKALPDVWQYETAAMLSQIGGVVVPETILEHMYRGDKLSDEESQLFEMHPMVGSDLVTKIPRMEPIARMIGYQEKRFDGSGVPRDGIRGEEIPIGARILKVVLDFDILEAKGWARDRTFQHLKGRTGWYDPEILDALEEILQVAGTEQIRLVKVKDLECDMVLAEDIISESGILLVSKGLEMNNLILTGLKSFSRSASVIEPIRVLVKSEKDAGSAT
jgi:response regulator RpfG family c-di-GMP phosphodiesterase